MGNKFMQSACVIVAVLAVTVGCGEQPKSAGQGDALQPAVGYGTCPGDESWPASPWLRSAVGDLESLRINIAALQTAIAQIRALRNESIRAASVLAKFTIVQSTFEWKETILGTEPVARITARNGLDESASAFSAKAKLISEGRTAPWVETTFRFEIPGGLAPGKQGEWSLDCGSSFNGDWDAAPKDRDDLVLCVDIVRVDGADGEPIARRLAIEELDADIDYAQARIQKLRAELAELEKSGT